MTSRIQWDCAGPSLTKTDPRCAADAPDRDAATVLFVFLFSNEPFSSRRFSRVSSAPDAADRGAAAHGGGDDAERESLGAAAVCAQRKKATPRHRINAGSFDTVALAKIWRWDA